MVQQKEFMLLFRYEANSNIQPSAEDLNQMHQQWGAFIGNMAIQEKLVSTHQLGEAGMQLFADGSTSTGMHFSGAQAVGGNMIVRASSLTEAAEMAKDCPILHMGGSVEIRDIQPM